MPTPTTPLTPEQLYQLIKEYEAEIPIPAPFVTVDVGTFDAAAGTFTGLTTQVIMNPEPLEHEPGQTPINPAPGSRGPSTSSSSINAQWRETVTREPAPVVPLAPVLLQFNVTNTTGPWSVTVDGYTTNVAAGLASVSVNVWDRTAHQWTLQVGAGGHQDQLMIQRKGSIPAAGGFTIPVLPVAIVYAPPADSGKKSTATYAEGDTVGTSITYDFSTDSSQTVEPVFADGSAFRAYLSVVADSARRGRAAGRAGCRLQPTPREGKMRPTRPCWAPQRTSLPWQSLIPSDTILQQNGLTTDNSSTVTLTYSSTSTIGTTALAADRASATRSCSSRTSSSPGPIPTARCGCARSAGMRRSPPPR